MLTAENLIRQARLLSSRLERVPVDSIWARRASGHRGALLKWIEHYDTQLATGSTENVMTAREIEQLAYIIQECYKVMQRAAIERLR